MTLAAPGPGSAVRKWLAALVLAVLGTTVLAQPAEAPRGPLQLSRQPQGLPAVGRLQFFEDTSRALDIEQVRAPAQAARFA